MPSMVHLRIIPQRDEYCRHECRDTPTEISRVQSPVGVLPAALPQSGSAQRRFIAHGFAANDKTLFVLAPFMDPRGRRGVLVRRTLLRDIISSRPFYRPSLRDETIKRYTLGGYQKTGLRAYDDLPRHRDIAGPLGGVLSASSGPSAFGSILRGDMTADRLPKYLQRLGRAVKVSTKKLQLRNTRPPRDETVEDVVCSHRQ